MSRLLIPLLLRRAWDAASLPTVRYLSTPPDTAFLVDSARRFFRTEHSSGKRPIFMPIGPDNDSSHDPFAFMATLGCQDRKCVVLGKSADLCGLRIIIKK